MKVYRKHTLNCIKNTSKLENTASKSWEMRNWSKWVYVKSGTNICQWAQKNLLNTKGKQVFITRRHLFSGLTINLLHFVQFLRKLDVISSFCISSTCILIQGCLDIFYWKQDKNTVESFPFFSVHATFNAMILLNVRLSAFIQDLFKALICARVH